MIGIYCIRHIVDGMCYVGQSVDIQRRIKAHFRIEGKSYLHDNLQVLGIESFEWEILELCEEENLNARECHWIATLDSMEPNGYNVNFGGFNFRHTPETRRKIGEASRGRTISKETRQKIAKANKGNKHCLGRKLSPETREKMSKARIGKEPWNKGKSHSVETRRKIAKAGAGRKHTLEARQKMSESRKGREVSQETRAKIGNAQKGEKNHMYGKRGKNNPHFGMKRSPETCRRISEAKKRSFQRKKGNPYQLTLFEPD